MREKDLAGFDYAHARAIIGSGHSLGISLAFALLLGTAAGGMHAKAQEASFSLSTNQAYVEDAGRRSGLPLADTRKMFSVLLGKLPDRVKVYPTENYYYFSFYEGGVRYAGNIRLDASTRDAGKIHFAYFQDLQEWSGNEQINYLMLDASHGVNVEKVADLVYRVTDGDKSVVFELNNLRGVRPPDGLLQPNERYIGPIFDESGVRFFLIYNQERKLFHYVLDETIPATDLLEVTSVSERISVGKRTGFAYYLDHRFNRKILIGVFEANARVNNYFDGPFDQLPDNFIEGEELRSAILEVEPSLKGRIDRFGGSADGGDRFMIAPYRHYRTEDELLYFHDCAIHPSISETTYPECFVYVESPSPLSEDAQPPKAGPEAESEPTPHERSENPR
jgi:hypothetical protein